MSSPTSVPPNGGGGLRQRLLRGTLLKWNEVDGYLDRDGVPPVEGPYLLWAMEKGYQRWKNQTVVDEIIDKPLPDLEQLNAAIPKSEWETGLDGQPRPPYSHQHAVYLLDPNDGQFFTLMNSTVGMKMLWESLAERWEVMRICAVKMLSRWSTSRPGSGPRSGGSNTGPILRSSNGASPEAVAETDWLDRLPQHRNCHRHRHHRHRRHRAAQTSTPAPAPAPTPGASTSPHAPPPPPRSASPPAPPPPPPARPAPSGEQKKTDGLAFLDQVKPPTLREELNDDLPFK